LAHSLQNESNESLSFCVAQSLQRFFPHSPSLPEHTTHEKHFAGHLSHDATWQSEHLKRLLFAEKVVLASQVGHMSMVLFVQVMVGFKLVWCSLKKYCGHFFKAINMRTCQNFLYSCA